MEKAANMRNFWREVLSFSLKLMLGMSGPRIITSFMNGIN